MRYLLFILLFFMLPSLAFAQSKADYEAAMGTFQHYYNYQLADSICNMFPKKPGKSDTCAYDKVHLKDITDHYGYMKSCTWLIQKGRVTLFKTQFIRSTHIIAMTLDKNNKLEKFVFKTTPGYVDSLVSNK